jgi:hypothetical protein
MELCPKCKDKKYPRRFWIPGVDFTYETVLARFTDKNLNTRLEKLVVAALCAIKPDFVQNYQIHVCLLFWEVTFVLNSRGCGRKTRLQRKIPQISDFAQKWDSNPLPHRDIADDIAKMFAKIFSRKLDFFSTTPFKGKQIVDKRFSRNGVL